MAVRYMSTKLGTRVISVCPGDQIRIHDHSSIELLPGFMYSGMSIRHDGHDLILSFAQYCRIKAHLDYVDK